MQRDHLLDGECDLSVEWLIGARNGIERGRNAVLDLLPACLGAFGVRGDEFALVADGIGRSLV